jgi:hypothetical protein
MGQSASRWPARRRNTNSMSALQTSWGVMKIVDTWSQILVAGENALEGDESKTPRHYHHETVCVDVTIDDINVNVRKGLDITKATNQCQPSSTHRTPEGMPFASGAEILADRFRSSLSIGLKRSSRKASTIRKEEDILRTTTDHFAH